MPKKKTKKSIAKRVKRTATGKFKRASAGMGHLLTGKSAKRKRQLRKGALVSKTVQKKIAAMFA